MHYCIQLIIGSLSSLCTLMSVFWLVGWLILSVCHIFHNTTKSYTSMLLSEHLLRSVLFPFYTLVIYLLTFTYIQDYLHESKRSLYWRICFHFFEPFIKNEHKKVSVNILIQNFRSTLVENVLGNLNGEARNPGAGQLSIPCDPGAL